MHLSRLFLHLLACSNHAAFPISSGHERSRLVSSGGTDRMAAVRHHPLRIMFPNRAVPRIRSSEQERRAIRRERRIQA